MPLAALLSMSGASQLIDCFCIGFPSRHVDAEYVSEVLQSVVPDSTTQSGLLLGEYEVAGLTSLRGSRIVKTPFTF